MEIENIPYYDYSKFPVNNDILLKTMDLAVRSGFKMIFINFGASFPWSPDKRIVSDFSYPEKLIEEVVGFCSRYNISLVPVLNILTDCDFILKEDCYRYLAAGDRTVTGIDPSASGAGKFTEEILDDIYSILNHSEFLLMDLPATMSMDQNKIRDMAVFIRRLTDYLKIDNRNLILGCDKNCESSGIRKELKGIPLIFKMHENRIKINGGNCYTLNLDTEITVIRDTNYRLIRLRGNDDFIGAFDAGTFAAVYDTANITNLPIKAEIDAIDNFLYYLDYVWLWIRRSQESLSMIFRKKNQAGRIRFLKAVSNLKAAHSNLISCSAEILDIFKKEYQPGVIKLWMESKMDPVFAQLSELEITANQIKDGQ